MTSSGGAFELAVAEAIAVLMAVALPPDETACYSKRKDSSAYNGFFSHGSRHAVGSMQIILDTAGECIRLEEASAGALLDHT